MTLKAFAKQARYAPTLKGQRCVRAYTGYARTLLLDFGKLGPPDSVGFEQPERGLVAECPWRLDSRTSVIVGAEDPEDTIDARLQVCVGKTVTEVTIYHPSYMLHVELSGGIAVWVFPDDSRDFASYSDYPSSSWYVAGYAIPPGWESDDTPPDSKAR